jgi:hypothetical protein
VRFWLSLPFIGRTRIGFSVSTQEIERAFRRRKPTGAEIEQRAALEAALDAKAQAFAEKWAPLVANAILIGAGLIILTAVGIIVWWVVTWW